MNATAYIETNTRLALLTKTAEDLMTINPLSLRERATVDEAIAFLSSRGFSGAPVITDAGKPVGFVGETDLLRHAVNPARGPKGVRSGHDGAVLRSPSPVRVHIASCKCPVTVGQIMRRVIVAVPRSASMAQVAKKMISRRVHRVFVIDETGALIGVISSLDVLAALCN